MNTKKRGSEMNATKQITSILSAMGAKPIATTENGTIIKVNAPILNDKRNSKNEIQEADNKKV